MIKKHKEFYKENTDGNTMHYLHVVNWIEDYILLKNNKPDLYLDNCNLQLEVPQKAKRIMISGENIYHGAYRPILCNHFIQKIIDFLINGFTVLPAIQNQRIVELLLNRKINEKGVLSYRAKQLKYVNALKTKGHEVMECNNYAILTNDVQSPNILNFPFFFYSHYHHFDSIIEVKKRQLYTNKTKFCAFAISNKDALDRINFFYKLSQYKKIDSYGLVLNNAKPPRALIEKHQFDGSQVDLKAIDEEKNKNKYDAYDRRNVYNYSNIGNSYSLNQELFRDYKFVICFENSYAGDYITEKLPNVMMANSIGIYRGAPNVGEFFNTQSFLNWDDYGSDEALIEKIIQLDQDDSQYQQMLAEPFFINNELPPRIQNLESDLKEFIDKMVCNTPEK